MRKQNQRTLSRSKSKSSLSSRIFLATALILAGTIGVVLWVAFVRSVQDQQHGHESQSAVQKLRRVVSNEQLKNQRHAETKLMQSGAVVGAVAMTAAAAAEQRTLILKTAIGDISIVLRPDLSKESVDYIYEMVAVKECVNCKLYRAEKPGILQGIIANRQKVPINKVKGSCPSGFEKVKNDCPEWDKSCACHGPVMTRGMVAWAAGDTGPDFFIDDYRRKADWWGTQHTVWGEIQDDASFAIIDEIWKLPAHNAGGLTMLNKPITFDLVLQKATR